MVMVRKLVKYTETSPIFFPSGKCEDIEITRDEEGWTRTIFPNANPEKREDTKLLAFWIQDMMANLNITADDMILQGIMKLPNSLLTARGDSLLGLAKRHLWQERT